MQTPAPSDKRKMNTKQTLTEMGRHGRRTMRVGCN